MVLFPGCSCCFSCGDPNPTSAEVTLSIEGGYYAMKWMASCPPTEFFPNGLGPFGGSAAFYAKPFSGTLSLTGQTVVVDNQIDRYEAYAYVSDDLIVYLEMSETPPSGGLRFGDLYSRLTIWVKVRYGVKVSSTAVDPFSEEVMSANNWASQVSSGGGSSGSGCSRWYGPLVLARLCRRDDGTVEYILANGTAGLGTPFSRYCSVVVTGGGSPSDVQSFDGDCCLPVSATMSPSVRIEHGCSISVDSSTLPVSFTLQGRNYYGFPIDATVSSVNLLYGASTVPFFHDLGFQTCRVE